MKTELRKCLAIVSMAAVTTTLLAQNLPDKESLITPGSETTALAAHAPATRTL